MMPEGRSKEDWQRMIEDHEVRLKALERSSKNRGKMSAAVQDAAQTKLADLWIELLEGKAPGYLFQAIMPLIHEHGWERVEPVLRVVLSGTKLEFLRSGVQAIPATFGALEARSRGKGNGTAAVDPEMKVELERVEDARAWILAHGGEGKAGAIVSKAARAEDGHDRYRNALKLLKAPSSVLTLLSQAGMLKARES